MTKIVPEKHVFTKRKPVSKISPPRQKTPKNTVSLPVADVEMKTDFELKFDMD